MQLLTAWRDRELKAVFDRDLTPVVQHQLKRNERVGMPEHPNLFKRFTLL